MAIVKAAPAPPASTAAPAAAVVKAAPCSVGSATDSSTAATATATTAVTAMPVDAPPAPTPTPNATAAWLDPAAEVGSATLQAVTANAVIGTKADKSQSPKQPAGQQPVKPADVAVAAANSEDIDMASQAVAAEGSSSSTGSTGSPQTAATATGLAAHEARDDGIPLITDRRQLWPPEGSTAAGSAATMLINPLFWQVGEGASPEVWWKDCSQEFAAALHEQRNRGIRKGRYMFYGNLAGGAIPFVHDFDERVQTNERTGQRKRLRLLQAVSLDHQDQN